MDRLGAILSHFAGICNARGIESTTLKAKANAGARDIVDDIQNAEKPSSELRTEINDIATAAGGWSEYIAERILQILEALLKSGAPLGAALRDAYNKSAAAAEKMTTFAKDHPILITVIALGVLAILAPQVLVWLGFTAEGVVEGSFAASWQAMYGGFVEAGSWFAYFQWLGTAVA